MSGIKLTNKQIETFKEISTLRSSADSTLDYALKFHQIKMNEVHKKEAEVWIELDKDYNLDIRNNKYKVEEFYGELKLLKIDVDG